MHATGYLIFAVTALSVLASAHYYLWARLVRDCAWPPRGRRLGGVLLGMLFVLLPLSFVLLRQGYTFARPLAWVAFVWMGLAFVMVILLAATDAVRLLVRVGERRTIAIGVAAIAIIAGAYGMHAALRVPEVKTLHVELLRLPQELTGMKVVQLTDLHVGNLVGRAWLARIVERTNELEPDLIVITGDLVDGPVAALRDAVAPIARLRSRYGVFFVTNHEYYSGVDEWIDELGRLGVRVLRNERVTIGTVTASFDLAGIDDANAARMGDGHGADLPQALRGYDPERELLLLAHQPKAITEASTQKVGLLLSGHTHGGQIWPFGALVRLTQPAIAGLSRHGETQLYVSRGTGFWGPPMRLGSPAEITLIELVASSNDTDSLSR